MKAVSYEIVDRESGNSIASFETEREAKEHLELLVAEDPRDRDILGLIQFDAAGRTLKSWAASDLVSAI